MIDADDRAARIVGSDGSVIIFVGREPDGAGADADIIIAIGARLG